MDGKSLSDAYVLMANVVSFYNTSLLRLTDVCQGVSGDALQNMTMLTQVLSEPHMHSLSSLPSD